MKNEKNYPVIGGRYRHYKGGLYKVVKMATHTETNEPMVVYRSLNFGSWYCRPLTNWNEPNMDNEPRFELITSRFRIFSLLFSMR